MSTRALTPLLLLAAAARADRSALLRLRGGAAPARVINGEGEFVAAAAAAATEGVKGAISVIASVGGSSRGRRLLNALFATEFDTKLRLGEPEENVGAWIAASQNTPSCLVLDCVEGADSGQRRAAADGCKLASFSLELADALIVHSPCARPSAGLVKESYERIFTHHLAARARRTEEDVESRTLLVHVSDSSEGLTAATVRAACKDAWATAAANTDFKGRPFAELFDLDLVSLPHADPESEEYNDSVGSLRAKLKEAGLLGLQLSPDAFPAAATSAWESATRALDGAPSEAWLAERYAAARSYEAAYNEGQAVLRQWAPAVAKGRLVRGFGPAAASALEAAAASFDRGVQDCSASAAPMLEQRRARLLKALQNDVSELFGKQHRLLTVATTNRFKEKLLKCASRGGQVAEWQLEGLRRDAEKTFDAGVAQLTVPNLAVPSRAQLVTAFGKQLTSATSKFVEGPGMQLEALGAMRRKTGKGQKPPRGVQFGLGLTGAVRSTMGGGQGNLQTFAGYTSGLNSAHLCFSNDGNVPDSSGAEPPPFRWQPKLNFDISI